MSSIDGYTSVSVESGRLWARLESGSRVPVECTVPVEGVLRLRVDPVRAEPGPSPMLDPTLNDAGRRPARLGQNGAEVSISGPGVEARWGRDGRLFQVGGFRRFADPPSTAPFSGGRRLDERGRPVGWVETAQLAPGAGIYGGGASHQGPNLRGRRRLLRNATADHAAGGQDAHLNVPLLWSDAGWGLFFHTGAAVDCDLGQTHAEFARFEVDGPELDLFVLTGDAPTILRRYLALTGMPGTLPDWAYGVWMGRSTYRGEGEVAEAVEELRAADCPVDVVHVDEWLDEPVPRTGTGPDRRRFPAGWARRLGEHGVRVSLWISPQVRKGSPLARRLEAEGWLVRSADDGPAAPAGHPDTLLVDLTDPGARSWWTERVGDMLREEGNAAVLADLGEEVPGDALLADGRPGGAVRNGYGLVCQQAVWDAGHRVRGDDFVTLCRSGTAGSQRYCAPVTGDPPATWAGLVSSLRACLSMSLSGFPVVTHDAGGYWTPRADADPELYARWAQWAAFTPIMFFHGTGRREPTAYPEPARTVAIEACRLHRRLQPYLVAAAEEAARTGMPIMRPMMLAHPGDRAARDADLQYLLGPDILVAPVLEPGGRCELWVPPGEWRPLRGLMPLTGPGWVRVGCGLGEFPAYMRAKG